MAHCVFYYTCIYALYLLTVIGFVKINMFLTQLLTTGTLKGLKYLLYISPTNEVGATFESTFFGCAEFL